MKTSTKTKVGLMSAAATVAAGPVAMADEMAGHDWSGLYVGGQIGVMFGAVPWRDDSSSYDDYTASQEPTFGGFVGYTWNMDSWVIGAELGLQTGPDIENDTSGGDHYEFNMMFDAKLKAGMPMGSDNSFLVYGFVGGSATSIDAGSGADYSASGVNFGAGVDYAVSEQVTVGLEVMARTLNGYGDEGADSWATHGQASLRAAFHF